MSINEPLLKEEKKFEIFLINIINRKIYNYREDWYFYERNIKKEIIILLFNLIFLFINIIKYDKKLFININLI